MSDLKEEQDICENCETSTYCSQLRLALAILGESLTESPNVATSQRYQVICQLLADASWNYPRSTNLCRLSDQSGLVRALTDELIQMAQKKPGIKTRPLPLTDTHQDLDLQSPFLSSNVKNGSLYEEETSCE